MASTEQGGSNRVSDELKTFYFEGLLTKQQKLELQEIHFLEVNVNVNVHFDEVKAVVTRQLITLEDYLEKLDLAL